MFRCAAQTVADAGLDFAPIKSLTLLWQTRSDVDAFCSADLMQFVTSSNTLKAMSPDAGYVAQISHTPPYVCACGNKTKFRNGRHSKLMRVHCFSMHDYSAGWLDTRIPLCAAYFVACTKQVRAR